jgi:rubrerythrin
MFKTDANLQSAFANEAQAYVRYRLFADVAQREDWPELANLFRAAAEAEMVHARNHFVSMGGIGNTKSNLLAAATSEQNAIIAVYPGFIDQAKMDRNESARISFEYALGAERGHNEIFEKAYQSFKEGKTLKAEKHTLCGVCGNLFLEQAPAKCINCGNDASKFRDI